MLAGHGFNRRARDDHQRSCFTKTFRQQTGKLPSAYKK